MCKPIKYLVNDIQSLLEILLKVNKVYYENYKFNLTNCLTLPSLSLKIYKSQFKPVPWDHIERKYDYKIIILKGGLYKKIKESYFGGLVDVFNTKSNKAFYYDINSEYPAAMLKPMPVGQPRIIYYTKDWTQIFGFVQVTIKTTKYIHKPLIPKRINNRLMTPLGEWSGWYFSE